MTNIVIPISYNKNCLQCKYDSVEKSLMIYETELFKVVLRSDNQIWFGRSVIAPKFHINPDDWYTDKYSKYHTEYNQIICLLTKVFKQKYDMTILNLVQLGNLTKDQNNNPTFVNEFQHIHFHFIPRYSESFSIKDINHVFKDPQFGKAFNADPEGGLPVYKPSDEELQIILENIRGNIILIRNIEQFYTSTKLIE